MRMSILLATLVAVAIMTEGQAFARDAGAKSRAVSGAQIKSPRDASTGIATGKRSQKPAKLKGIVAPRRDAQTIYY